MSSLSPKSLTVGESAISARKGSCCITGGVSDPITAFEAVAALARMPGRLREALHLAVDFGVTAKPSRRFLLRMTRLAQSAQNLSREIFASRSDDDCPTIAVGPGAEIFDCYITARQLRDVFLPLAPAAELQQALDRLAADSQIPANVETPPELLAAIIFHLVTNGDAKIRIRTPRRLRNNLLTALTCSEDARTPGAPGGFRFFITCLLAAWGTPTYPLLGPEEIDSHTAVGRAWSHTDDIKALLGAAGVSSDCDGRANAEDRPVHFSINFPGQLIKEICPPSLLHLRVGDRQLQDIDEPIGANILLTGERSAPSFGLSAGPGEPLPAAVAVSGIHKMDGLDGFIRSLLNLRERLGPEIPLSISMADLSDPTRARELVSKVSDPRICPQIISFEAGEALRFLNQAGAEQQHSLIAKVQPEFRTAGDPWGRNGLEFPNRALNRALLLSDIFPTAGAIRLRSHYSDITLARTTASFWSWVFSRTSINQECEQIAAALLAGRRLAVSKVTLLHPANIECLTNRVDPLPSAPAAAALIALAEVVKRMLLADGQDELAASAASRSLLRHGWTHLTNDRILFAVPPPEFPATPKGNSVGCGDLIDTTFAQFLAYRYGERK